MEEDKKFSNGGLIQGAPQKHYMLAEHGREWVQCKKCGAIFEIYGGPIEHCCIKESENEVIE